jgi:NAD dependent epimerase/dehydratase family enzyme
MGSGRQWMSWISVEDYPRVVSHLLSNDVITGPVNIVAPNPVTNAEFSRTLARVLGRPSFLSVPKIALELAMGEMAEDTILASQRVLPRRLLETGFEFQQSTLESAVRAELARQSA